MFAEQKRLPVLFRSMEEIGSNGTNNATAKEVLMQDIKS